MRSSFNDNMGPTVKDSPPSSPGSESMSSSASSRRKRRANETGGGASTSSTSQNFSHSSPYNAPMETKYQPKEEKDSKIFDNGVNAPHMLGNQLNPNSSMAQKMSDTLSQEMKAHSIFTEASNSGMNLVGPPLHSRVIASAKASQNASSSPSSFSGSNNSATPASNVGGVLGGGTIPQTLDQLLERQWEQGSQFLMDQAQHFDIASLLSCLHQLRAENLRLEENVNSLLQRRDHLLAVNARLAIPLTSPPNNTGSHTNVVENGLTTNSSAEPTTHSQFAHRAQPVSAPQPSTTIRHSAGGSIYQGQSSNLISQNNSNNSNLIRNTSADMLRNIQR